MPVKACLCLLSLLLSALPAIADVVYLKDGRTVEGSVTVGSDGSVRVSSGFADFEFSRSQIERIEERPEEAMLIPEVKTNLPAPQAAPATPVERPKQNPVIRSAGKVVLGKDPDKEKEGLIKSLLALSGIETQIRSIPEAVKAQLLRFKDELDPSLYEEASKLVSDSYKPNQIYDAVVGKIRAKFERGRFISVLKSLKNPVVEKIIAAQKSALSDQYKEEKDRFIAELDSHQPSQARLDILQVLNYVAGSADSSIKMQARAYKEVRNIINLFRPPEARSSPESIESETRKMQRQLEAAAKNTVIIDLLVIYRNISDQELQEYIKFYMSDDAKWLARVQTEYLNTAWSLAWARTRSMAGTVGGVSPRITEKETAND